MSASNSPAPTQRCRIQQLMMNRQSFLPARTRMMVDRIVRVGERYLCQLYLGQAEEEKRQHADRKCLHVLEFVRGPAKSQSPRGSASTRHDVTLERFVATDAHVACPAGGCPSSRLARYTRGPIGAPERDTPPATTGLEEDDESSSWMRMQWLCQGELRQRRQTEQTQAGVTCRDTSPSACEKTRRIPKVGVGNCSASQQGRIES